MAGTTDTSRACEKGGHSTVNTSGRGGIVGEGERERERERERGHIQTAKRIEAFHYYARLNPAPLFTLNPRHTHTLSLQLIPSFLQTELKKRKRKGRVRRQEGI